MNQIRYGATPAHVHVRQEMEPVVKEESLPNAVKELEPEKIKVSWEIEDGK